LNIYSVRLVEIHNLINDLFYLSNIEVKTTKVKVLLKVNVDEDLTQKRDIKNLMCWMVKNV
jgi:hypothetical protein